MKNMLKSVPIIALLLAGILAAFSAMNGSGPGPIPAPIAPAIDGQIYALQVGSTVRVVERALAGSCSTCILQSPSGLYMFASNLKDGWAFAVFDGKMTNPVSELAKLGIKGNVVNARTFSDFRQSLLNAGWKPLAPAAVPLKFMRSLQYAKTLLQTSGSMSTSGLTPVFIFSPAVVEYPWEVYAEQIQ